MVIEFSVDANIAVHKIAGEVDPNGIIDYVRDGVEKWADMPVLWDFSDAHLNQFSMERLKEIAQGTLAPTQVRQGMKTALFSNNSIHSGVLLLYEVISDYEENPIKVKVFESREKACCWLLS